MTPGSTVKIHTGLLQGVTGVLREHDACGWVIVHSGGSLIVGRGALLVLKAAPAVKGKAPIQREWRAGVTG